MRILHVINSLATGGAEKLILDSLPLYAKAKIQVDLLVLDGGEYPFMEELRNSQCCKIYCTGIKSIYNPVNVFKMIRFLKAYDIIHGHLFPVQYFLVFAKLLFKNSLVLYFTEHNTTNRRMQLRFFRSIDKWVYKRYSKIICITNEIKEILLTYSKLNADKFVVINNGINLSLISNSGESDKSNICSGIVDKDFLVIQVSSFREQKDQATLIRAMSFTDVDVKLILVGDGPNRTACERQVRSLNLNHRVFFLGIRRDIPELLRSSDVVVLSSKYEGLSLSSLEGMASGRPFIASNVPGLTDIVNGAGLLFPVGDHMQLATYIRYLRDYPDEYACISNACLARAKSYDINLMIDKHLQLYGER